MVSLFVNLYIEHNIVNPFGTSVLWIFIFNDQYWVTCLVRLVTEFLRNLHIDEFLSLLYLGYYISVLIV